MSFPNGLSFSVLSPMNVPCAMLFALIAVLRRNIDSHLNCLNIISIHFVATEVVRAMSYIIQEGWTMYWGTSRWSQFEVSYHSL